MLTNSFFIAKNSVSADAVVDEVIMAGELGGTALAMGITAPEIIAISAVLIGAGVIFYNKDELMDICGSIATMGVIKAGSSHSANVIADSKKVVDAYNEYVKTHTCSISKVPYSALCGKFYTTTGYNQCLILSKTTKSIVVPQDGGAVFSYGRFLTSPMSCEWDGYGFKVVGSNGKESHIYVDDIGGGYFKCSEVSLYYQDGDQYLGANSFVCQKLGLPIYKSDSICADIPKKYSPCKDLGNDTFAEVPSNNSISVDSMVNRTASQVAEANPSIQFGQGSISVPMGKVLTPEGSIALNPEGSIDFPKTAEGDTTAEGSTTAEGDTTAEKDTTKDDTVDKAKDDSISKTLDFDPILKIGADLKDIFPFCVPFDLIKAIKMISAAPTPPKFDINFSSFPGGKNISIDFSGFEVWAEIARWFFTAIFTVYLIIKTRGLIKG